MNKLTKFSFCLLIMSFSVISEASQVDFGWSTPEFLSYKKDSEEGKQYLVWVYSLKNTTDKKITMSTETFLKTDTARHDETKYIPEIAAKISEGDKTYISAEKMRGEYDPGVTKKGIVIFEDIDPNAQKINIFVTGLAHFFFWKLGQRDYSYKITYRKSGDKWILEEHDFTKDN